jgi:hypothetical protein
MSPGRPHRFPADQEVATRIGNAPSEDPLTEQKMVGPLHLQAQRFRLAGS